MYKLVIEKNTLEHTGHIQGAPKGTPTFLDCVLLSIEDSRLLHNVLEWHR